MAATNGVMMQYFHWYNAADGTLWDEVHANAADLAQAGITALWLPPAYKGINGANEVGYAVYDMYDLGEFAQQGSTRTKYGTKAQYLAAIQIAQAAGLQIYADAVLNHRMGGDVAEICRATPYAQNDRLNPVAATREISAYTQFNFPAREGQYSSFQWNHTHFDAVDYDALNPQEHDTIYLLGGKKFDDEVALDRGNYAYLMGCDLDFQNPEVQAEVINWGKWTLDTTGVDGFRLDAVKHIAAWFFPTWIDAMEQHAGKDLFVVGEYWTPDSQELIHYIDRIGGRIAAFDVPLHYQFHTASREGAAYNLCQLGSNTVDQARPEHVVTFVDNHDSQPLQALESPVEAWFKPLAYAFILLRQQGYPCIFYPDYYGARYEDIGADGHTHEVNLVSHRFLIDRFLHARQQFAYGEQVDYFNYPNCIGWTRLGDVQHPKAMAVVMSNGLAGHKRMFVGRASCRFNDITQHYPEPIYTNNDGWADFVCPAGSVSVWVQA
ncbi:alpha-amylase [Deefgea rivuli]|uniref:alpha-amylase n=1 Tax=Deefgea rivuli TaxID=400948 RepID=UPI0004890372|nr:alpha-amylase [Deefgea rivuli]